MRMDLNGSTCMCMYSNCPKISYTKVSDKMAYANNMDANQIAPEAV